MKKCLGLGTGLYRVAKVHFDQCLCGLYRLPRVARGVQMVYSRSRPLSRLLVTFLNVCKLLIIPYLGVVGLNIIGLSDSHIIPVYIIPAFNPRQVEANSLSLIFSIARIYYSKIPSPKEPARCPGKSLYSVANQAM